jgi:FkbM family methyltransferase
MSAKNVNQSPPSIFACVFVAMICFVSLGPTVGCHSGAPTDILTNGKKLYTQFNEELIIRHYFDDMRHGSFVDVGSWQWRDGSTTYYLEEHLGWRGLAIDAQESLRSDYEKHRPRTKFFSYIVTDHSGTREKLFLGGQISSVDPTHFEQFPGTEGVVPQEIEVPTITLNELLSQNGVTHFDFLSIDIEGAEPQALAGFDIKKYAPRLVCIEAAPRIRDAILDYFSKHDYERIDDYLQYDAVNWYFRPRAAAQPGSPN